MEIGVRHRFPCASRASGVPAGRGSGAEVVQTVGGSPPEGFGKLIASELELWEKVVKDAGISAQE